MSPHRLTSHDDSYDDYEDIFNPLHHDRQARRKRKRKAKHTPKKDERAILNDIAATQGLEGGFNPTYRPSLFEEGWLLDALRPFYDSALIADVEARAKGGKEANVYRCAAHPTVGTRWLAAKVYRPRQFRNLRNDALYREGRSFIKEDGRGVKKTDHRIMRALQKKTQYGLEVAHISWLQHEVQIMQRLHALGAHVPRPYGSSANAVLMSYYGDEGRPAPTLHEVVLSTREARRLCDSLLEDVRLILRQGYIHGDLSAYNILYWGGEATLIDFPQVILAEANTSARLILARDLERLCGYFNGYGLRRDPLRLAEEFWRQTVGKTPDDLYQEGGFAEDEVL